MADKPKVSLPRVGPEREKLGLATIMDRALAARHGVRYVHLAAFAIDIDRARDAFERSGRERPFGWDVFLTEARLIEAVPPEDEAAAGLLEDTVLSVIDGEADALGAQLVFAIWNAIERGVYPATLRSAFRAWRARPKQLVKALRGAWEQPLELRAARAAEALEAPLDPPLAPPTREALLRWSPAARS